MAIRVLSRIDISLIEEEFIMRRFRDVRNRTIYVGPNTVQKISALDRSLLKDMSKPSKRYVYS